MYISITELLSSAKQQLLHAGVETDYYELRVLLAEALGTDVVNLPLRETEADAKQIENFYFMLSERQKHKPIDKIIGRRGFYKYDFIVNTNVLSPRPDTEILVENAISAIKKNNCKNILELGVGSGCVISSILADVPDINGVGVDKSPSALEIAQKNAEILGVAKRLKLYEADWFCEDFLSLVTEKFNIIVSNPPYISKQELSELDKEVILYDPIIALDGGEDGLESYRKISILAPNLLTEGGLIFLEVGENQADDVISVFEASGMHFHGIYKDLSGIKRCISMKK
ncbi:MAG: peptide chain release factor N(5)-glutamine methyltransferase [Alphaproteobacteria bacterium]|nr:peptide chain release factor N(5)-glutamine methyltransferase [Alphaproteobacteria bacterium]